MAKRRAPHPPFRPSHSCGCGSKTSNSEPKIRQTIKCDLVSYQDLARRLDELISGRDQPGPAWSTYRRLLTIYCSLRQVRGSRAIHRGS